MAAQFDAVVVAESPHARVRLLGLTLVERGRRVAARAGARRVFVLDAASAGALAGWDAERGDAALVIVRAGDQVIHMPLIEALAAGTGATRIAVGPGGEYAGASWSTGAAARDAIAALARAPAGADRELADAWRDAERVVHGDIARHPATTRDQRRAARDMLLRLIIKSEDSAVSNLIYRPLSRPITRLLLHTPITPNQVSILVAIIGMIGCYLTAQPGHASLILGAALVFSGGVIDGCDGEIARLKLTSSRLGAWLDTIVDELTTTAYFTAIGLHFHAHHPASWVVPSIAVGLACYALSIFGIYYFLIVVSKTGNSQHYVGKLEVVESSAGGVVLRPRPAPPSSAPRWLRRLGGVLILVVRRDFVNVAALALALANAYAVTFAGMLAGGVITALIVVPEHVRLRGQLREVARRGGPARFVPS